MAQGDQCWRELRARCPDSFERLERFALQWFADSRPDFSPLIREVVGPIRRDGLAAAAEDVLAAVQRELTARSSPLARHVAKALARVRFYAIMALIDQHGEKHAKQTLIRVAAPNPPLTICMGHSFSIRGARQTPVTTIFGEFSFCVQGCHSVFVESNVLSGNSMWAENCPDCRSGRKKPARTQERALKRRINAAVMQPSSVYVALRDGSVERRPAA